MEVELVGRGLAVVGWGRQGRWRSPPEPKFRWRRGQHPDGHLLEGDLEEADLGWVEVNVLLGESSNQTVSWSILDSFESYVLGIGSSFLPMVALDSDVASVVAEVTTLAACLV